MEWPDWHSKISWQSLNRQYYIPYLTPARNWLFGKRSWLRPLFFLVTTILILFIGLEIILFALWWNTNTPNQNEVIPFPISVNPDQKSIVEDPSVDTFFVNEVSDNATVIKQTGIKGKLLSLLAGDKWYQNLASVNGRVVVIWPGERKEESAHNIGVILGWTKEEEKRFTELVLKDYPDMEEGVLAAGRYQVAKNASPEVVAKLVRDRFENEVGVRYTQELEEILPFKEAMIIASLLEREARDFTDMREISGVIWNRLFIDMKLQLDATLQYIKGSEPNQPWWPIVIPKDKYRESPFNTYQNTGLPPSPIASPSLEAVLAALNPVITDCLFYFHDSLGNFYCSKDYRSHVSKLRQLYGRGR